MKIIAIILIITLGSCASSKKGKCPAYGKITLTKNNQA